MNKTLSNNVELHFPVLGTVLPSDHGYALYAAISRHCPDAHKIDSLGIHSIRGSIDGLGKIRLTDKSILKLRMPIEVIPHIYNLAGKKLDVNGNKISLALPQIITLQASNTLWSRLVILKIAHSEGRTAEPTSFVDGLNRQLAKNEISGSIRIETENGLNSQYARRVLRLKGTVLTGYGVFVDGLSESDSYKLQEIGLGGKRKMGCGLFLPRRSSMIEMSRNE